MDSMPLVGCEWEVNVPFIAFACCTVYGDYVLFHTEMGSFTKSHTIFFHFVLS